jgi:ATP-dependent Lon protease
MFFKNDGDRGDPAAKKGRLVPLLPLRDIIVFPHMVVPLFVGRDKSLSALEDAMAGDKQILLAAQRRANTDDPSEDDIFSIGTVGHIIQLLRFPKGPVKVLVEGRARARVRGFHKVDPFFVCDVEDFV